MFRPEPQTATEWLVRLNAGPLSSADRYALMRWLAADPERLKELEGAEAINRMAMGLSGSAAARGYLERDMALHARAPRRPLRVLLPLSLAAAAGLVLFVLMPGDPSGTARLRNHSAVTTALDQIADYVLPDTSRVTVAANSMVSVDFTNDRRDVSLARGEAFFDVQHDAGRPFVITAGERQVTVTGTRFNVNTSGALDELEVAVVEGRVNVSYRTQTGGDGVEHLGAGDVMFFSAAGDLVRKNLTPEQAAAWRARKLYFDSARLSQVLAEVNRYAAKPLVPESQDIERLMLTGQFQAGDVASVLTSLRQLYGIEARETTSQWLLVRTARTKRGN